MRKLFFLFFVLSESAVYYKNVLRFEVKNSRILHLMLKEWMTRPDGEKIIEDEFKIECLSYHLSRLGWFTDFKSCAPYFMTISKRHAEQIEKNLDISKFFNKRDTLGNFLNSNCL